MAGGETDFVLHDCMREDRVTAGNQAAYAKHEAAIARIPQSMEC